MPKAAPKKRQRRAPEELVAALQAKIEAIKARAERKRAKSDPSVRYTVAAVRNMDKATAATADPVLKRALEEARGSLTAYLSLQGVVAQSSPRLGSGGRRSATDVEKSGTAVLDYVRKNPGQRGEQIAEGLGIETKVMRGPMRRLIEDGVVATKGLRRGMRYYPV